jgi:hypothetical protein
MGQSMDDEEIGPGSVQEFGTMSMSGLTWIRIEVAARRIALIRLDARRGFSRLAAIQ